MLSIVGLTFDVFEEVIYVADNDPDTGNGRLWSAPTATSGNLAPHTYDDATWEELRHMIRDGGMPGLLYIAAKKALLKSPDGLNTVQAMRNLSGGREGMMIGYGAERMLLVATTIRNAAGTGKVLDLGTGPPYTIPPLWYLRTFDDSAWATDVACSFTGVVEAFNDPIPGGTWTTGRNVDISGVVARWLYRLPFTLPPGAIERARLTLAVDDYSIPDLRLYVNGIDRSDLLPPEGGSPPFPIKVFALDPADLTPGPNLIAIQVPHYGGPTALQVLLEVNA